MDIPTNGEHRKNTVDYWGERMYRMELSSDCRTNGSVSEKELRQQVRT